MLTPLALVWVCFQTGPGPIRCDAIDEGAILPIVADFDTATAPVALAAQAEL